MSECSHNCAGCSQNCSSRTEPQSLKIKLNDHSIVHKCIGVISGKGGVGKSMVTSMLAATMQARGYQCGIIDADVTGPSIPQAFGLSESLYGDGVGIVPAVTSTGIRVVSTNLLLEDPGQPVLWRGPVIGGLVKQLYSDVHWGEIDYLFVDMPPGTGDVALTVFQSYALDGIVIVTTPQDLVSMIVEKAVRMAQQMDVPIVGIVENMSYVVCPDCGKHVSLFGQERNSQLCQKFNLDCVGRLPLDPALTRLVDQGKIELAEVDYLDHLCEVLEEQ